MYFVCFSTATLVASLILFQGFNTTSGINTLSLLIGFIVTFLGVHLLNLSRRDAEDAGTGHLPLENGMMNPRLSSGSRLSIDGGWPASPHAIGLNGVPGHVRRGSRGSLRGSGSVGGGSTTLFSAYEPEVVGGGMALERLGEVDEHDEDEDEGYAEDADERSRLNPSKRDRPRDGERDLGVGGRTSRNGSGERIAR